MRHFFHYIAQVWCQLNSWFLDVNKPFQVCFHTCAIWTYYYYVLMYYILPTNYFLLLIQYQIMQSVGTCNNITLTRFIYVFFVRYNNKLYVYLILVSNILLQRIFHRKHEQCSKHFTCKMVVLLCDSWTSRVQAFVYEDYYQ